MSGARGGVSDEATYQLRRFERIAGLGTLEMDIRSGIWRTSGVLDSILGIEPDYPRTLEALFALVHPNDVDEIRRAITSGRPEDGLLTREVRVIRAEDEVRHLAVDFEVAKDSDGSDSTLFLTAMDITDRKRLEDSLRASEAKYRSILECMQEAYYATNVDGRVVLVNPAAVSLFGFESEESMIGVHARSLYADPEVRASVLRVLRESGAAMGLEHMFQRCDGAHFWGSVDAREWRDDHDGLLGTEVFVRDITKRKRAEDALRASEARFETVFRASPFCMTLVSLSDGRLLDANDEFIRTFGYARETFAHKRPDQLGIWERPEDRASILRSVAEDGRSRPTEISFHTKADEIKTMLLFAERLDLGDEPLALLVAVDMTERKRAESALARERGLLEHAESASHMGSWRLELATGAVEWSPEMHRILGLDPAPPGANMAQAFSGAIHPDDRERVEAARAATLADGIARPMDYRIVRPDGGVRWLHAQGEQEADASGEVAALVGFVQDITERREIEDALRASELKYATAFRTSPDAIGVTRLSDGRYVEINEGFTRLLGYDEHDAIGKTSHELGIWGDREERARLLERLDKNHYVENLEARFRRKNGTLTNSLMSARIVDIDGEPCVLSIVRDISDMKEAQASLAESENRYRSLFQSMLEGYAYCRMVYDEDGQPVDFEYLALNDAFARSSGLGDVTGKRATEVAPNVGIDMSEVLEGRARLVPGEAPRRSEVYSPVTRKWFHTTLFSPQSGDVVMIIDDITKRKRAEIALERERALLASAESAAHMGSWRMDVVTGAVEWSEEMYRIFGLEPSEFGGNVSEAITSAIHPDDRAGVDEANAAVMRDGVPRPLDYRVVRPDGTVRWVHAEGRQELNESGAVASLSGFVQDVTERKEVEREVAEYQERLKGLAFELKLSAERERSRLAVELHDRAAQTLVAAQMEAQLLGGAVSASGSQCETEKLVGLLRTALSEIRGITTELGPPVVSELGLGSALGALCDEFEERHGLRCALTVASGPGRLRDETGRLLHRMTREALNNVVRHAGVEEVTIRVERDRDEHTLTIADHGRGFDPVASGAFGADGGFGLFSMREDVMRFGGSIVVQSAPGSGTTIEVRIPASDAQ